MKKVILCTLILAGCAGSGPAPESSSEGSALETSGKATPSTESAPPMTEAAAAAMARPPGSYTAKEVFEKLLPLGNEYSKKQPFPKKEKRFDVVLPSDKPRGDEKGEWITSVVKVYFRDGETVNQITIQTESCNINFENFDQSGIKMRVQEQVALVTKSLFALPFALQDKYFRALSPDLKADVRLPIKEDYAPVLDMRLIRGYSKCDGKLGVMFRYDFFMK